MRPPSLSGSIHTSRILLTPSSLAHQTNEHATYKQTDGSATCVRARSVGCAGLQREEEEVGACQHLPASTLAARWAATVVRHSTACAHSSAATSAGDARRAGVRGLSCGSGAGDVAGDGDDVAVADGSSKGEGGDRRVVGEKNMLDRAATMTSAAAGSASGSCAPAPVRARSSMSGMAKDGNACGQVIGRQPPVGGRQGEEVVV